MTNFINVKPIWYNSAASKYQEADNYVAIAVDHIAKIYYPSAKQNQNYYTIWFKGETHQDVIKTYDDVIDLIERKSLGLP